MKERIRPPAPLAAKAILGITLFLLYLPLAVMIVNSLSAEPGGEGLLSFYWYTEVFQDEALLEGMARSFIVGISSGVLSMTIGALAAVAIARSQFRLRLGLEVMSFVSLIIPELVFALALLLWFYILQVPLSLMTVIFAHVTFSVPFVMIVVGAKMASLDISYEDAARDLGASEYRILRSITLPLLKPALASAFILSFLLSFDDFLITFYTNGVGADTLPIKLYSALKVGITPKLSAMATLMFLFTLTLILLGLRGRALRDLVGAKPQD